MAEVAFPSTAAIPLADAVELIGSESETERLVREGRLRMEAGMVSSSDLIRVLRRRRDADVERRLREDLEGRPTADDSVGLEWLEAGEPDAPRRRPLAAALVAGSGAATTFCLRCPDNFCAACPVQQKAN